MPSLDARRTYTDGQILFAADLDAVVDDIETILNVTKLNDDNIQNNGITASAKLVDASISEGKLASSAVTATKIADNAVITAKLIDEAVQRAKIAAAERIPTATVLQFAGSSAPTGWLLADGSAVSRSTYSTLFAIVGTTYGAGDGSTTFNLPNMCGRTAIGAGTGSGLTARTLGATGGAETHQLTVAEMPSHTHTQDPHSHVETTNSFTNSGSGTFGAGTQSGLGGPVTDTAWSTKAATATNQSTGGGGAHNNMQPFLVQNFIIKH
jgi:microcystin-dependent protein